MRTLKRILILITLFTATAQAICLDLPKPNLNTNEVLIQTNRVSGIDVTNIIVSWPTTDPTKACCTRAIYDRRAWQVILDEQTARGTLTLTDFVMGITAPGTDTSLITEELAICQSMADRILAPVPTIPPAVPAVYIIVAPNGTRPDRPLYNDVFADIGRVEIMLNGSPRVCEPTPVDKPGVSTKYYWVTNNAGVRGLAVCKPN